MPYAERIRNVRIEDKIEIVTYVDDIRIWLSPANPEDIGRHIFEMFEALGYPAPSTVGLRAWFNALGNTPEWAIREAVDELLLHLKYPPKIADLWERITPKVGPYQREMLQAQALVDYGREPEPDFTADEETRARVRRILEDANIIRRVPTDESDNK